MLSADLLQLQQGLNDGMIGEINSIGLILAKNIKETYTIIKNLTEGSDFSPESLVEIYSECLADIAGLIEGYFQQVAELVEENQKVVEVLESPDMAKILAQIKTELGPIMDKLIGENVDELLNPK